MSIFVEALEQDLEMIGQNSEKHCYIDQMFKEHKKKRAAFAIIGY